MNRSIGFLVAIAVVALGLQALGGARVDDPYLWLEDVHGNKPLAWVKEQNAKSLAVLKADPDYGKDYDSILAVLDATDRIPFGGLDHQYVFNFWQDAQHKKGIWRRTTIADYATADPKWETLLDIDTLSADEKENWVWKGASCTASQTRCLVALSRGGGDAAVFREFDPASRSFITDGFLAAGSQIERDLCRQRHDPVFERFRPGLADDIRLSAHREDVETRNVDSRTRRPSTKASLTTSRPIPSFFEDEATVRCRWCRARARFFETEYYLVGSDGKTVKAPPPSSAVIQGAQSGRLIATLRDDGPSQGPTFPKGAFIAVPIDGSAKALKPGSYAPGARASVERVSRRPRCRLRYGLRERHRPRARVPIRRDVKTLGEQVGAAARRRIGLHRLDQ